MGFVSLDYRTPVSLHRSEPLLVSRQKEFPTLWSTRKSFCLSPGLANSPTFTAHSCVVKCDRSGVRRALSFTVYWSYTEGCYFSDTAPFWTGLPLECGYIWGLSSWEIHCLPSCVSFWESLHWVMPHPGKSGFILIAVYDANWNIYRKH